MSQQLNEKGISIHTINFSPLIRLSEKFGIYANTDHPFLNHVTITFTKGLFDGTTRCLNYAFDLNLLTNFDACHLQEYFKYVFFDEILYYFIQCEKELFKIEGAL